MAATAFERLPSSAVEDGRRAILDWLGSALAGSLEPPARMTHAVVAKLGTSDDATVFAAGRASAAGAALGNGVATHILELDDVHKGSTLHAAAPVIPAALGVAERERVSGRVFMAAVVAGYDAALRVGEAVNPTHYRFWHPTGTAATFGAAAAAGVVLRLDGNRMWQAFGSAGTQAAGLWEFNADGSMSKHLHPGKAAFNGVMSADLAREGFTGAGRILEGERGFFRAMSTSPDGTRITDGLGERWKVSENCYKIWACCGHTHSAIDVARDLRAQREWSARDALTAIKAIHIETYGPGYEIVNAMNPSTPYQAKFSIAYCVAAALLHGGAPLEVFSADHFSESGVRDAQITSLLRVTNVSVAADLTAKYPTAWPTRLRIDLSDGTTLRGAADFPVGNPENPVSTGDLERKFTDLVAPRWGSAAATRALSIVRSLDTVDDMATAFREFGAAPAQVPA